MDWNDGAGIALTINGNRYASLPDSEKANTGRHAAPVPCQYDWRDGCDKTATWRVGCGPNVRFYCDSHEGPPCGGVFFGEFVITPDTTREELAGVVSGGSHRIYSASGRDVHELRCCACGGWIGDTRNPYIEHVSIPLQAECHSQRSRDTDEAPCRACGEMRAVTPSTTPPETP